MEQKKNAIELETENGWDKVNASDLVRVFSLFGHIDKVKMGSTLMPPTGIATIEFSAATAVDKVLGQAYYRVKPQGTMMVRVTRWMPEEQKIANRELEERERELAERKIKQFHEDMFLTIRLSNQTEEQIKQLSFLQSPSNQVSAEDLRNMIKLTLQQYIPELQVHVIGSFYNGLSVPGSNLSLLLELGEPEPRTVKSDAPPLPSELISRLNIKILDGYITFMSLKRNDNLPWVVYEILHRCTLLAFAELTKLLVQLDPRVRPLYIVVRLWAQQLGFYPGVFTNKNLLLLLYFYLQNTKPPVLPSLDTLKSLCEDDQKEYVYDIDVSFCRDISHIRQKALPTRNQQTMAELVQGFFKYFSKYDLVNRVFCPRSGRSYNMLKWRNMKNAVPILNSFENVKRAFHIQDLFIQQVNASSPVVKTRTKHLICTELLRAAELTQGQVDQGWNLLTFIPLTAVEERTKPKLSSRPSVVLPFCAASLPDEFLAYNSYAEAERQWFQWTVELTKKVLDVLRIEYKLEKDYEEEELPPEKKLRTDSLTTEKPSVATEKLSDPADFSTEYYTPWSTSQECCLTCVDTENLWQRRSPPGKTSIENEERITMRQLETEIDQDYEKSELRFSVKLKHVRTANEIQLEIYVEVIGISMNFFKFHRFFSNLTSTILNKSLRVHMAL